MKRNSESYGSLNSLDEDEEEEEEEEEEMDNKNNDDDDSEEWKTVESKKKKSGSSNSASASNLAKNGHDAKEFRDDGIDVDVSSAATFTGGRTTPRR